MKSTPLHPYHILIENGKRVLISDCRKILEYSPERIIILLHSGQIELIGSALTLCDFFGDEIQIRGALAGIVLKGENDEKSEN